MTTDNSTNEETLKSGVDNQDINQEAKVEASESEATEATEDTTTEDKAAEDAVEAEVVVEEEQTAESKLEEALKKSQDQYLRLSAEFDNYRKRTTREKLDLIKNAGEPIFKDLIPVLDDFGRAMIAMSDADDSVKEGMALIENKFLEFFSRNGVKPMDAVGTEFDTDHHEAMVKIPAPTEELKGKVVEVVEKGYYLNDKVLRFAKVVVGE